MDRGFFSRTYNKTHTQMPAQQQLGQFGFQGVYTGQNLTSLRDWSGETPLNGNTIVYDAASNNWKNGGAISASAVASDVSNTATLINERIALFSGVTGKLVKGSALSVTSTGVLSGVSTPLANTDATNKSYVDLLVSLGVSFVEPVKAVTTAELAALSGTQTVDGVTLIDGDRVLVKNGTAAFPGTASGSNGIYLVASGAWTRSADSYEGGPASGKTCAVEEGSVNNNAIFTCNTTSAFFGDAITFVRIASFSDLTGPSASTDTAVVRWSGTVGSTQTNSAVTISNTGAVAGALSLAMNGATSGVLTVQPASTTVSHALTMPPAQGAGGTYLQNDGTGLLSWTTSGDITGPGAATDNAIARFDTTTGKMLQNSVVTVGDTGAVAGALSLSMNGATSGSLMVQPAAITVSHTLTLPSAQGAASTYLKNDGIGALTWAASGDVTGPLSAVDNALARFDSVSGKLLQNSTVTVGDTGAVAGVLSMAISGSSSGVVTVQAAAVTTPHTLTLPAAVGTAGTYLKASDGAGTLTWAAPGDLVGPSASTDNALARFDATSGKLLQNSIVALDDLGNMSGVIKIAGLDTPTAGTDATNKSYVDNAIAGLKWKEPVRVASTANVAALSTLLTLDGVVLVVGDRVLLRAQTNPVQTGIYVAATGGWSRSADLTTGASAAGVAVFTTAGTLYGNKAFVCSNTIVSDIVGTADLVFVSFLATAAGDVYGPAISVDNAIARFDATTGKLLQSSGVTISDTADLAGTKTIALSGSSSGVVTLQAAAATTSHTLTLPVVVGATGTFLKASNGTGTLTWATPTGDVAGPSSSTDNAVARFDTTTGKLLQNSGVTISDTADVAGAKTLAMSGSTSGALTMQTAAITVDYTVTLPGGVGASGTYLKASNGTGTLAWATAGDVTGPSSSTNNQIARFDSTTGKLLKTASPTISDTADLAGVKTLAMSGSISGVLTVQPAATTANYTLTLPGGVGASGTYLKALDGTGTLAWAAPGDVYGPASSTDNAVARFDTTTGKLVQNSSVTISDTGDVAGAKTIAMSGATSGVLTVQPAGTTTNYAVTMPAAQGAAGSLLSNDGAGALSWLVVAGVGAPVKGLQRITASGTYTPTAGTTRAFVYCTGGGGGGGGCVNTTPNNSSGSGGNGGGTYCGLFAIDSTKVGTVTIGVGGTGSIATTGNTGGNSTFLFPSTGTPSATITGPGGFGGIGKTASNDNSVTFPNASFTTPSATATNAVLLGGFPVVGQAGSPGIMLVADSGCSGDGGNSMFGNGAQGVKIDNSNTQVSGTNSAVNTGGGGSGAIRTSSTTASGGNGGSGVVIIMEY